MSGVWEGHRERGVPSPAAGTLGEDGVIARRTGAGVSVRPRREASRAVVSVASSPGRSDLLDGADDAFGEGCRVGPAAGQAPRAEPRSPLRAPPLMAPRPLAEEAMVGVGTPAPVPGRGMTQPAAGGGRQRHRGPNQKHGDGGLTQHGTVDRMQGRASRSSGPEPWVSGSPSRPNRGAVSRSGDADRHSSVKTRQHPGGALAGPGRPRNRGGRQPRPVSDDLG